MTNPRRTVRLTADQEALAELRDGAYLVLAPPGSGKTEVLSQRIVRLLSEADTDTSRLLALTFTRKAAREMRQRVEAHLDNAGRRALITTYHGFADELLRQHGKPVGFSGQTTVYSGAEDRIEALFQGFGDEGIEADHLPPEDITGILERISRAKRDLQLPESVSGMVHSLGIPFGEVYGAYERALSANDATDFDGLLLKAYQLLANYPGVAKYYRRLYRWLLVDEGQDTCLAEYELLRAFCGEEYRNVFIVADRDQSIFRFRGASTEYLDRFVSEFGAEVTHLGANFRCAEQLVRVAYAFLTEDEAPVRSHADAEGWVAAYSFATEKDEARWVAQWSRELLVNGLHPAWLAENEPTDVVPEEIAVLARTRRLLDSVCREFDAQGMPYVLVTGDSSVFDSDLFRKLLYALRVRANHSDLALRRALLGQFSIDMQAGDPGENGVRAFFADLAAASLGSLAVPLEMLASSANSDVTAGARWLASWDPSPPDSPGELDELIERDVNLLRERVRIFINTVSSENRSWQGLVRAVIEQPPPEKDGVRVMTIHGAKGLEFRAVAVVGMNEGSLPDFRSASDPAEYEAERRLAYVAASRASRALVFTRSRSVSTRYGPRQKAESPLLADTGLVVATL